MMTTKKPTKIIRTDKWTLNPTSQQRVLFAETVQVYRRLCRYLVGVVLTHWPDLGRLSSHELVPAVERLIHATAKHPKPRYALIDKVFLKFPSYYRRAAIMFAAGQVSSYLTRYQDWVSGKGWKARGGRKRSSLRQRFHGWLKAMIRDCTEMKWTELGGKVVDVVAAYTSKLAYDGSGEVKRDPKNYALAKFSTGKRYNCDLNGAQNIAARGILKLTRRNDREERSSKRSGRSPMKLGLSV